MALQNRHVVECADGSFEITLQRTKTSKVPVKVRLHKQHLPLVNSMQGSGAELEPANALASFIAMKRRSQRASAMAPGALFTWADGAAVTAEQVNRALRTLATAAGADAATVAGLRAHSLRAGGATAAAEAGMQRHQIMALGRWKSDAVDTYIRSPAKRQWAEQAQLAVGGHTSMATQAALGSGAGRAAGTGDTVKKQALSGAAVTGRP